MFLNTKFLQTIFYVKTFRNSCYFSSVNFIQFKKISPEVLSLKYDKKQKFLKRTKNEYYYTVQKIITLYPRPNLQKKKTVIFGTLNTYCKFLLEKNRRIKQFYRLQYPLKTN